MKSTGAIAVAALLAALGCAQGDDAPADAAGTTKGPDLAQSADEVGRVVAASNDDFEAAIARHAADEDAEARMAWSAFGDAWRTTRSDLDAYRRAPPGDDRVSAGLVLVTSYCRARAVFPGTGQRGPVTGRPMAMPDLTRTSCGTPVVDAGAFPQD